MTPVKPPGDFRGAFGRVLYAEFSKVPPFIRQRKYTGRKRQGIVYERKAQEHLLFEYPETYVPSPWINFKMSGDKMGRWCQPDGLLIAPSTGIITTVEIKYSHTPRAWWQVRHLYQPVLLHIFPPELWKHQACEVVKWYDPAIQFPEAIELTPEISRDTERFKIHIFNS